MRRKKSIEARVINVRAKSTEMQNIYAIDTNKCT